MDWLGPAARRRRRRPRAVLGPSLEQRQHAFLSHQYRSVSYPTAKELSGTNSTAKGGFFKHISKRDSSIHVLAHSLARPGREAGRQAGIQTIHTAPAGTAGVRRSTAASIPRLPAHARRSPTASISKDGSNRRFAESSPILLLRQRVGWSLDRSPQRKTESYDLAPINPSVYNNNIYIWLAIYTYFCLCRGTPLSRHEPPKNRQDSTSPERST